MAYKVRSERFRFDPKSRELWRLSRSKVDLFLKCPRCFYLDQRLGIAWPETYPLTLNIAVDELLKREFDILRENGSPHPVMQKYGIDAVPFKHEELERWRDALRGGVEFYHAPSGFSVRGGVDDIWVTPEGELLVVDYKATAKRSEITLDGDLGAQYKRQMEVYQWLLRENGFTVSPTGYFFYVNGKKDAVAFDGKLEFDMMILPCEGNTDWIVPTLLEARTTLSGALPEPSPSCDYCAYRKVAAQAAQTSVPSPRKHKKEHVAETTTQSKIF
jgi:CRISPR/Cas system-associated exonuclease Cas4 (RecB family)